MRGLRRHQNEPGLDDDRRTLIHRYMVDQADSPAPDATPPPAQPQEPVERLIVSAVPVAETPADPIPAPSVREVGEVSGGEVSVDVFRQTLEHVVRLSGQVASAGEECSRRRERLTTLR